jgi:hypothetical protein
VKKLLEKHLTEVENKKLPMKNLAKLTNSLMPFISKEGRFTLALKK